MTEPTLAEKMIRSVFFGDVAYFVFESGALSGALSYISLTRDAIEILTTAAHRNDAALDLMNTFSVAYIVQVDHEIVDAIKISAVID